MNFENNPFKRKEPPQGTNVDSSLKKEVLTLTPEDENITEKSIDYMPEGKLSEALNRMTKEQIMLELNRQKERQRKLDQVINELKEDYKKQRIITISHEIADKIKTKTARMQYLREKLLQRLNAITTKEREAQEEEIIEKIDEI